MGRHTEPRLRRRLVWHVGGKQRNVARHQEKLAAYNGDGIPRKVAFFVSPSVNITTSFDPTWSHGAGTNNVSCGPMSQNLPSRCPFTHDTPFVSPLMSRKVSPVLASAKVPRQKAGPCTWVSARGNAMECRSFMGSGWIRQECNSLPASVTGPAMPLRWSRRRLVKLMRPPFSTRISSEFFVALE